MSAERSPLNGKIADSASFHEVAEENRRLRRTMRDLVALSTLPALWSGAGREAIARSLSDALFRTLSLDLIYVRLQARADDELIEAFRSKHRCDAEDDKAIKASLIPLLDAGRTATVALIDPLGRGLLRAAVIRFGVGEERGVLVACSSQPDFPNEQDRLLLSIGANQTAIVLQRQQTEEILREQREWFRVTLEGIADAVIATDIERRVTFMNPVAEALTKWTSEEARGKPLHEVFTIVDESTRQVVQHPTENVCGERGVMDMANRNLLIAKDGTEQPIDHSAAPIRNRAGEMIGVVMVFRGLKENRRAEQFRNARLAITQVLNEAAGVDEVVRGVLRAVCENLGWELGFYWAADNEEARLQCRASWHRPLAEMEAFAEVSRQRTFNSDEGLPGRVWRSGRPEWVLDVTAAPYFVRHAAAAELGLRSAFACPVAIGGRMLGIIEFLNRRMEEADEDLLEVMSTVATNLAQFIERSAAEDELRDSERQLAEFFENATVGLHWVGPDGKILRVNRAELEMLGYGKEEYVGRSIAEFHADEEVICDILNRLSAGEKLAEYPARLRCKDGSIKDVLIDSSVQWKEGKFVHTRCFTRDVTERKRFERALVDARSRLDTALEAGAIATWTWDIPRNLLFGDSKLARLFNAPASTADGDPLDNFVKSIHPEDVDVLMATLERAVQTGETFQADYRIMQPDGSVRWVTARGIAERDQAGRPVRMPGVIVDITQRKVLEEELRIRAAKLADADRRKDEFLATLAHELRNPLAPIRNALEILKMPSLDAATLDKTRSMMERQLHQLVRLVDDLLDVARVMRGKIELRKERVELAAIIARAVETVQPLIAIQGHRLELSLPQSSLLVDGDPVRLAQVVGNLLTNSAKYTESNGHISVVATREGDDVVLRVRDDGIGIAAEMLPHIFDLFVQVDHATTKAQGGLGIGLTLARNLVHMHNGTIEAHSAGIGAGSEFVIRLPLAARQVDTPQRGLGSAQREYVPSGHRLLVVDDNKDAAESLALLLGLQGHEVKVAHNGVSALAIAASFRPRLVFLDIGMPDMDGCEVACQLRRLPGLENVVLAAVTGWGQAEDRRRSNEAGFDHHLVKPPEPEALQHLLDALA